MQFDLLKTEDIDKNGLYLDFFQVYNWGVFDSKVYTMRCGKKATLLTGLNGSGKTTLVDAFLSLIVPPLGTNARKNLPPALQKIYVQKKIVFLLCSVALCWEMIKGR